CPSPGRENPLEKGPLRQPLSIHADAVCVLAWTTVACFRASHLEVAIKLHGDVRAVGCGHMRFIRITFRIGFHALDRASRIGGKSGGGHLRGGVSGQKLFFYAVLADVSAFLRIELSIRWASVGRDGDLALRRG